MLEGLEITIVNKNDAFDFFFSERIDPEFYQEFYTNLYDSVLFKGYKLLGDIAFVTDGEHGNAITFPSGYSKYYGARNVLAGILSDNDVEFISEHHHHKIKKSALKPRDILISCVGANIGYAAIAPDNVGIANIVRNVALIRSVSVDFNNEYLLAYFRSKFGKNLFIRMNTGNAQPLVSLDYIKTVPVYKASMALQCKLKYLTNSALDALNETKNLYSQAETLLLEALNLTGFSPSNENTNVKSFQESFGASGRLDAEYYQPKYEEIVSRITSQPHKQLSDLVGIQKSIEPGSDTYSEDETGLPFLRVADYNKFGITKPQKRLNATFVAENSHKLDSLKPKKNTILFSKDGSVGEAYCLREDGDFITSGAILHLTVQNTNIVLPDYLTLALNSKLVKMQAERDAGGSIILHWRVGEIENVIVPLVDMPTQSTISALIQQSFTLKSKSEQLLDIAKRAVEIAVEQDEAAAIAYIEANS